MADITLAEFNGRVWLVSGEGHLQDLLANTLSPDISIELVQCEHSSAVHQMWVQNCGEPPPRTDGMPWQIHPNIVERIRRRSPDYAVFFSQWSAMLDQDALIVINAAAARANENPDMPVVLAEYLDPEGPQSIVDLSRLRAQLIEDRLAESGVTRQRIERIRRSVGDVPGMSQESQRVDIVVRAK
jgi:hypothetical protein